MSRRVFVGGLVTETNVFSPIPTGYADYVQSAPDESQSAREQLVFGSTFGRYAEKALGRGFDLVQGTYAFAFPAGVTVQAAYERLRDPLLRELGAAMPVDAILLTLHGAMVAEGYEDCETDIVSRARAVVGSDVPIGVLLDPHCDLPDALIEAADAIVIFKEYPHTDVDDRAGELAEVVFDAACGRSRPVMATFDCRMIGLYPTTVQPMRGYIDHELLAAEAEPGVLSVSLAHGFLYSDTSVTGARALAVTNGDADLASVVAEQVGRSFYDLRHEVTLSPLSMAEGLDRALEVAASRRPVVVADMSDNTGGGAPGDSTFVLRELLSRGVQDAAIAPFWDPVVVQLAFAAEEGAQLRVRLGGKTGPSSGEPLDLTVRVKGLVRGLVQLWPQTSGHARMPCGDCAYLECDGVGIVVTSTRQQAFGVELFTSFGVDPASKSLLVLKSSNHFNAAYAPLAAEVIYMAPPGALIADPRDVPYTKVDLRLRYPHVEDPWAA